MAKLDVTSVGNDYKLWRTVRYVDGSWQTGFDSIDSHSAKITPGGWPVTYRDVDAACPDGQAVQFVAMGDDGRIYHTVHYAASSWQAEIDALPTATYNFDPRVACCSFLQSLCVVSISQDGTLWYIIRNADGTWQSWNRIADHVSGGPPFFQATGDVTVSTTLSTNGQPILQFIGIGSDGQLYHTIRNPDGTWQSTYGNIVAQGTFQRVACIGTGGSLQVVAVRSDGQLMHAIRDASGNWSPFGYVQSQSSGGPPAFVDVGAGTTDGQSIQVVGVGSDGQLWHTIRNPSGLWQSSFGKIETVSSGGPSGFGYISGSGSGSFRCSGVAATASSFVNPNVPCPIKHIFVLMLENHSFDNIFGQSGIGGIEHATTADSNAFGDTTYSVASGAPSSMPTDPGHEFQDVVSQLAGSAATYPSGGPYPPIDNSGFAANYATSTTEGRAPVSTDIGKIMLGFNTPTQLPIIYQLATEFALCDHWFASIPGPTWPNRFFVHGASSAGLDHSPTTTELVAWESFDGFTYPNGSVYDLLTSAGLSWRLYNDDTDAYTDFPQPLPLGGAIAQVSSLKGIHTWTVNPLSSFASDLLGAYPYQYTFIEPNYGDVVLNLYSGGSSQHPMDDTVGGEGLIKAVYEAIRNSPLWNQSLLIIVYDEHGGFYDSVAPGPVNPPNDGSSSSYNAHGFVFNQLGVRVPAVIVSPWIAKGVIDQTIYDHSSVLATLENIFGLRPLTGRDAAANDLYHLLQQSSSYPRTDCPTTLNSPAQSVPGPDVSRIAQTAGDDDPLSQSGNLPGFLGILLKAEIEMSSGDAAARQALIERFTSITTYGQARAYIQEVVAKIAAAKQTPSPPTDLSVS